MKHQTSFVVFIMSCEFDDEFLRASKANGSPKCYVYRRAIPPSWSKPGHPGGHHIQT